MTISFHSNSVAQGVFATLLSAAELAAPRHSQQPNDFLERFRVIKSNLSPLALQKTGILGEIGRYTSQLHRPEIVEQTAVSLLFPHKPIVLETNAKHHPDSSLTLGACLMCEFTG